MIATDLSADVRALADHLMTVTRGDVVTVNQLTTIIGRDVSRHRHLIYSAFRVAERESGAVFCNERGVGYRRLAPGEIVKVGQTARSRIRGYARRGNRTMAAGIKGANDLAPAAMRAILAEQSALGLLEHIARDKSLPLITEEQERPLPIAQSAQAFLKQIGAKI